MLSAPQPRGAQPHPRRAQRGSTPKLFRIEKVAQRARVYAREHDAILHKPRGESPTQQVAEIAEVPSRSAHAPPAVFTGASKASVPEGRRSRPVPEGRQRRPARRGGNADPSQRGGSADPSQRGGDADPSQRGGNADPSRSERSERHGANATKCSRRGSPPCQSGRICEATASTRNPASGASRSTCRSAGTSSPSSRPSPISSTASPSS